MKKVSIYLALLVAGWCQTGCRPKLDSLEEAITQPRAVGATYTVTVNTGENGIYVSPRVMGFNTVYCYEKDAWWGTDPTHIPERIKVLNPESILRYPGGSVTSEFNWEDPTGQGWREPGDADYDPAKDLPESDFMRLWEYLGNCNQTGAIPLIGVNMSTGEKFPNLRTAYHNKARRLAEKIRDDVSVDASGSKYVYLDNEPYMDDAVFKSATQYAHLINTYAGIMRPIDPTIKFIVNTHPNLTNKSSYTDTLIMLAGNNIDYIDVHYYWKFNYATWQNWVNQEVMARTNNQAGLKADSDVITQISNQRGHGNRIKMVVLEWNLGPETARDEPPLPVAERRTPAKIALMQAEQFMDVLNSGTTMACFWPVSWPFADNDVTLLASWNSYIPTKAYHGLDLFKTVLKKRRVTTNSATKRIRVVAAKSQDSKKLFLYVINKTATTDSSYVEFTLNNAIIKTGANNIETLLYDVTDTGSGPLNIQSQVASKLTSNKVRISMPQYSFARVTVQLQ